MTSPIIGALQAGDDVLAVALSYTTDPDDRPGYLECEAAGVRMPAWGVLPSTAISGMADEVIRLRMLLDGGVQWRLPL